MRPGRHQLKSKFRHVPERERAGAISGSCPENWCPEWDSNPHGGNHTPLNYRVWVFSLYANVRDVLSMSLFPVVRARVCVYGYAIDCPDLGQDLGHTFGSLMRSIRPTLYSFQP